MSSSYHNLINQSYKFPQNGFKLHGDNLHFHDISLKKLIKKYGSPFKLFYLPEIRNKIKSAKTFFQLAFNKHDYQGSYQYSYCTKCNHFSHVISTAIKENVHLETSSSYDIDLIIKLFKEKKIDTDLVVINNGYKTKSYLKKIISLYDIGFENLIIVLDNKSEIHHLSTLIKGSKRKIKIGIRMAINEEPQSAFYTSRMGIRANEIIDFYKLEIANKSCFELKMLHFFVDSGINDNVYYWGEFQKALTLYSKLKKLSLSINSFNIGGGLPIRNNLNFNYDYAHIIDQIIKKIKKECESKSITHPNIFSEFGKYTVGESGAIIFEVLEQKTQNDNEDWYLVNNSLMNTIPDAWSIHEKFILLPINKWKNKYKKVNIGGISCDRSDYYNSEDFNQDVLLPAIEKNDSEPLYLGFFHTGAYQDAISGYGGIKHCLIPSPKHVIIDKDDQGNIIDYVYSNEQSVDEMFHHLGYK
tara:strand:+ start:376 stop:1785 length:1410 start_codon:yes stop_codon:yes gene_type:complete